MSGKHAHVTKAEALDALKRSGYLLESRLEGVLREQRFRVEANSLVPDDLTGKSREIDLWAGWTRALTFGPEDEGDLSMELVIECVNPSQPVAFITKERQDPMLERTDAWEAIKIIGNPPEMESSPHNMWTWLTVPLDLGKYHHYRTPRVSTQYCSFAKKAGAPEWMALHRDEDHQAIRKLCMATDYFVRDLIVPGFNPEAGWSLTVVYPVLVIQGPLYEVRPSSRSARLLRADHLQYRCRQAIKGDEQDYQIDVVTERYFPKYLAMLQRESRLMVKRLNKKYPELMTFRRSRLENLRRFRV